MIYISKVKNIQTKNPQGKCGINSIGISNKNEFIYI